jgi:HAD superfamily hydrolase (TIGR01509 family)
LKLRWYKLVSVWSTIQVSQEKRAVLFDLDGVLVRTEALKAEAHAAAVRRLGGKVSPLLYRRYMGKSHEAVRSAFLAEAGIKADLRDYTRIYQEEYRELLRQRLTVAPGAAELLRDLVDRGFSLGLVTSSRSWMTDYVLDKTGLDAFFNVRVSAEDVKNPKPAPDSYRLAMRLIGARLGEAVAIEDSESGVEAATRAGLAVVAIRHSWNQNHDFAKAIAVFDSLQNSARILAAIESAVAAAQV